MRSSRRALVRKLVDTFVGIVIVVTALAPLVWGLSTSFKAPADIVAYPPELVPSNPTLDNYGALIAGGFGRFMGNSIIVSAAAILLCLAVGSLAGYALARFRFRGRGPALLLVIVVMSIPLPSLIVPTYTFAANLGLLDTRLLLVLLYTAYQLPLVTWILMGFFQSVPEELEHAAMIDGYGRLQTLTRVVLPLARPGLVAAGLFVLLFAWNDFVVALVMTDSEAVRTLPVAIYFFLGFFGREWGPLTAAAMIAILPVVIIFVVFQRAFLSGVTSGAMKG